MRSNTTPESNQLCTHPPRPRPTLAPPQSIPCIRQPCRARAPQLQSPSTSTRASCECTARVLSRLTPHARRRSMLRVAAMTTTPALSAWTCSSHPGISCASCRVATSFIQDVRCAAFRPGFPPSLPLDAVLMLVLTLCIFITPRNRHPDVDLLCRPLPTLQRHDDVQFRAERRRGGKTAKRAISKAERWP